jgi:hypothetical protein
MTSWESIKDMTAEINGINKRSSFNNDKLYTNEEIMMMFIFKLNDKYRYSSLVSLGMINDCDKTFVQTYETNDNYLKYAVPKMNNYIPDIKNKIKEIINEKDVKFKPLIFIMDKFTNNINNNNNIKIDTNLLAVAVPELTNLNKYRYLAKLLYDTDSKYLDYAKESIINENKNISLDKMVFGIDLSNVEKFSNKHKYTNSTDRMLYLIIIILIIIVIKNIYAGSTLCL